MRERLGDIIFRCDIPGITPARAGKTSLKHGQKMWTWDHPRSCGKDTTCSENVEKVLGSPPLVRERLSGVLQNEDHARITPARAGKTRTLSPSMQTKKDHPRSCGKDHN